jgi:sulfur-carrier protein adenylyltransferase/sulfurtransferase
MLWKQLFAPVKAIEPEEAKALIAGWPEGSYTLLDVRQPGEYEKEHLPGAKLVPMAALPGSLKDLDPEKPVIVY